jgi:hypothetical protein
MKKSGSTEGQSASELIDKRIAELGDWRGETLSRMRKLIQQADSDVVEEWKWMGTPVWSHDGILCTGESYKSIVKLTFAKGASLKDPAKLFNSSLEGNARRAIDIHEGEQVDAGAFKTLIRAAVAFNTSGGKARPRRAKQASALMRPILKSTKASAKKPAAKKPALLAGGNPQIAKAHGNAPVQAYIAAMPGWKRDVGRRLDALIARHVPNVRKAVKWNSPFYGIEGQGWFLGFHVFTHYVKVTFFRGTSLRPIPPGGTGKDARWIDLHENDLDEAQMATWIRQAASIPGWDT